MSLRVCLMNAARGSNAPPIHLPLHCHVRSHRNDITGRLLSVVGGSLVVRGFEEAERLARAKKGGLISLGGMQLPWASGKEDGDSDGESTEGPDEQRKKQGDTRGARRGARKEGAAELGGQPQTGGGADGSSGDAGAEDGRDGAGEDESFATRLWPKSGSWLRPRVGWLRTLGMSKDDAEEEEQRATKEKTTQEAMKNEGEAKQDAPEAGDEDDPIDGEEQTPGEGGKEEEGEPLHRFRARVEQCAEATFLAN